VLEGKPQYVDLAGNLALVTQPTEPLCLNFHSFRVNRLPFTVHLDNTALLGVGSANIWREPVDSRKVAQGKPLEPVCGLDIILPELGGGEEDGPLEDEEEALTMQQSLLSESKPSRDFKF